MGPSDIRPDRRLLTYGGVIKRRKVAVSFTKRRSPRARDAKRMISKASRSARYLGKRRASYECEYYYTTKEIETRRTKKYEKQPGFFCLPALISIITLRGVGRLFIDIT